MQQGGSPFPKAKVESVPERGFKCRTVTKSPGALVALLHLVRLQVLKRLRGKKILAEVLKGDRRKAVTDLFGRDFMTESETPNVLVSADLTAATDLLPLDLVEAIWSGYRKVAHPDVWEVLSIGIGPQDLHYPDGSRIESSRGILMGLPTTWVTLCLVHEFWVEEALRRVKGSVQ